MEKPVVIGIVTKHFNKDTFYGWSWMRISNNLRYALTKNGALCMGILPQSKNLYFQEVDEHDDTPMSKEEQDNFVKFIDMCDGIVLQGGMNSCYYEEFTAKYCYEKDIPLLGICAGYNTMIRALGGTTVKLINDEHDRPFSQYVHSATVTDENSLYYSIVKEKTFMVNSIHQYIGGKIPPQLSVVSLSCDGQVEVVEAKDKKFYLGIKHHPELLCDIDEKQNRIFEAFIKACKK